MLLLRLKEYVQKTILVNLRDLTERFEITPDVARDLLRCWINKGCIKKCSQANACGKTCVNCDPLKMEVYCWVQPTDQIKE